MKQYVDKSVIIAEIERRKKYYENIQKTKPVYESNIENLNELLSFLNALEVIGGNDREQPQGVEYYDPYKAVVESIAEMCVRYDKASHGSLEDFYDNVRVKCKDAKEYDSLFSLEQWKPSKEQLKALSAMKEYCDLATSFDVYSQEVVESLYQDLKKIKGE